MAAVDVKILKDSGTIAVRRANANLRISGFRLLYCSATVDMDRDPEVFMMLEPVVVDRSLKKATPNTDSRNSSRRLRTIFKVVIIFFRWSLPSGEKMLRERGIYNLPDEVFEEIKAALARPDSHFSRFPAMAIKRCLLLFTANVVDRERILESTANSDPRARDLAREAWEAVKHFKAMLTKDWATFPEPNLSFASGPPASWPPVSGPPAAGPWTPHPPGVLILNQYQPNSLIHVGAPFSSPAATGAAGHTVVAPGIPTSAATTRGHGPGGRTASKPSRQLSTNLDDAFIVPTATASLKIPNKRSTPSTKPSPTSILGKHPRGEPDLDEGEDSRPVVRQKKKQKHYDDVFDAARAGTEAREACHDRENEKDLAWKHEREDKSWVLNATQKDLGYEVLDLRRRVRILEKEKDVALSNQRQQLRPGLVSMKMSPRVQQHTNRLFPSTSTSPLENRPKAISSQRQQLRPGLVTMKMGPRAQQHTNQLFPSISTRPGLHPTRPGEDENEPAGPTAYQSTVSFHENWPG